MGAKRRSVGMEGQEHFRILKIFTKFTMQYQIFKLQINIINVFVYLGGGGGGCVESTAEPVHLYIQM